MTFAGPPSRAIVPLCLKSVNQISTHPRFTAGSLDGIKFKEYQRSIYKALAGTTLP